MTRAEDLLKALNGLRNAADNELSGQAHDVAMQHIKGLFRLADFDGEDTGEGANEASIPFAQAIAEVRTQAEGEMSGNAFYLATKSLDDLANLSAAPVSVPPEPEHAPEPVTEPAPQVFEPVTAAPEPEHAPEPVTEPAPQVSEPVSETPAESPRAEAPPAGPNFDELAAAAKARVAQAAASLGLEVVDRNGSTHDYHEALELEKRSSEPCSMPEIEPIAEEVVPPPVPSPEEPAVVEVIEAASAREVAEATHDFGIPAAVAEPVAEYAAPHEEPAPPEAPVEFKPEPVVAPEPAPQPAPEPEAAPVIVTKAEPPRAAPVPEAPPVTAVKKTDAAPKQPQKEPEKTFFGLWLDMVFGRKK